MLCGDTNLLEVEPVGSEKRKLNARVGGEVLVGQSGIQGSEVRVPPHGHLKNPPVRLFSVGQRKPPPGSHTPVPGQSSGENFQLASFRLSGPTGSEDAFVIFGRHLGRPQIWADSRSNWEGGDAHERLKVCC